ncbi:ERF superfamily protein [compost metagenome]
MSAIAKMEQQTLVETPRNAIAPSATPADLLRIAVENGADLDRLERLMALQERWDANEARKSYVAAMTAFKAEKLTIVKGKKVEYTGTSYMHAELSDVTDVICPALARHQLSHRWDVSQEGERITVDCVITHVLGHSERVTMQAMPDNSGKKNAIQQVASTITYLQRYTLLAATGVATKGQDDDARGANLDTDLLAEWVERANAAISLDVLNQTRKMAGQAFQDAGDVAGWNAFKVVAAAKAKELGALQ